MPRKSSVKKSSKKNNKIFLSHRNILITSVVVIILLMVVLAGVLLNKSSERHSGTSSDSSVTQVMDEGVTWLPEKQEIKIKEQLFTPDWDTAPESPQPHYYKVGEENGKDIIIAILPGIDPTGDRKIMMVRDGGKYTMRSQYSSVFDAGSYYGPKITESVNENYAYDISGKYRALDAPKTLEFPQGVLTQIAGGNGKFFFSDYEKSDEFRQVGMKKFIETPWGTLFTYTVQITSYGDGKSVNVPPLQQYVLKLADGEARTYQMHPQFVGDDNVLLVTWSDGQVNKDAFTWNMTNGGCGASGFVEVLPDGEVGDLIAVGKTVNGETIYGFKNSNNPTLKGHYDQLPNGTYYFYDSKTGENKQIPISIDEYNAKHGVVVYKDSFGRYDVFVNQAYGTGAECGKPVIYLYPTKTSSVSVQVGANITKSEPLYGSGWSVVAQPDGSLKNTDGKQYDSLFWEGLGRGQYPSVDAGFVVAQSDLKKTIWDQVHMLGLNNKEAKDFMDFWIPKMPTTPYVRLTWFGTRQMDELAPLAVSPKPDTSIRLFLDFAGLEKPITIPTQVLSAVPRKGFTLVEWGGLLRSGK